MSLAGISDKTVEYLLLSGREKQAEEYQKLINGSANDPYIPQFHFSSQSPPDSFRNIMTTMATVNTLNQMKRLYPSRSDISQLRELYNSMTKNSRSMKFEYTQYKQLAEQAPPSLQPVLSSKLFLEIGGVSMHTINAEELFRHLDMIPLCVEHFVELKSYDILQTGFIDEESFRRYIIRMTEANDAVRLQCEHRPDFEKFFTEFVTQRIMVTLDPFRTGRVAVDSLIADPLYLDFITFTINPDSQTPFDFKIVNCVAREFLFMDQDCDGLLCPEDLMRMEHVKFTEAFVNRVFEVLGGRPADFSWFVRFRVAWDNVGVAKFANSIMFDIMDVDGDGKITQYEMNYFFKEINNVFLKSAAPDHPPVTIEYVTNELFDMFCASDLVITKEMFMTSPKCDTFVRQLADIRSFMKAECGDSFELSE